jgi:hypothetical protein
MHSYKINELLIKWILEIKLIYILLAKLEQLEMFSANRYSLNI